MDLYSWYFVVMRVDTVLDLDSALVEWATGGGDGSNTAVQTYELDENPTIGNLVVSVHNENDDSEYGR